MGEEKKSVARVYVYGNIRRLKAVRDEFPFSPADRWQFEVLELSEIGSTIKATKGLGLILNHKRYMLVNESRRITSQNMSFLH